MTRLVDRLDPTNRRVVDLGARIAEDRRLDAWLVGGPVRDLLLERPVRDLDFVLETGVAGFAEALSRELRGELRRHDRFLTFEIVAGDTRVDVTTSRRERYEAPGDLPLVEPGPIEDDLRRRDFAINAIAVRLPGGQILDPVAGRNDIESKTLRVLHETSFLDDPTRIMRAIRLGIRLRFDIDAGTRMLMDRAIGAGALGTISDDRFWREILLAFDEDDPSQALEAFAAQGVLARVRPGLDATLVSRRVAHAKTAVDSRPDTSARILYLGALFAGDADALSGAPLTEREKRRITNADRDATAIVDALRTGEDAASRLRAVRGFDAEPLALAAAIDPSVREVVDMALAARTTRLPFSADELGLEPGPHLGTALSDAREAIAAGILDPGDSLDFARERALRYLNDER